MVNNLLSTHKASKIYTKYLTILSKLDFLKKLPIFYNMKAVLVQNINLNQQLGCTAGTLAGELLLSSQLQCNFQHHLYLVACCFKVHNLFKW